MWQGGFRSFVCCCRRLMAEMRLHCLAVHKMLVPKNLSDTFVCLRWHRLPAIVLFRGGPPLRNISMCVEWVWRGSWEHKARGLWGVVRGWGVRGQGYVCTQSRFGVWGENRDERFWTKGECTNKRAERPKGVSFLNGRGSRRGKQSIEMLVRQIRVKIWVVVVVDKKAMILL